jgi:hypothetical protein
VSRCSKTVFLFDHLVGELLQIERHVETEHFDGREVDGELEFRGLLHRQIARSLALENSGAARPAPGRPRIGLAMIAAIGVGYRYGRF